VSTSFGDTSVTIDPDTTTSFGLDITYTRWNMFLSVILNEAVKRKKGVKTNVISLVGISNHRRVFHLFCPNCQNLRGQKNDSRRG